MKKLISLLLCALLALGTVSVSFAEEEKEYDVIRILCNNDVSSTKQLEEWEKYDSSQILIKMLDEIGIKLELECIDRTSFDNVVSTRMAAQIDLPDLVAYLGSSDDVIAWADAGLVQCVSDLVEKYDEDGSIKAFYDEYTPGAWDRVTAPDGNVWWFSSLRNVTNRYDWNGTTIVCSRLMNAYSPLLRNKWLTNIGAEAKDFLTLDELFDILVAFQEQDANGNGLKDEVVAIDITSFANGIAVAYGMTSELLCGLNGDNEYICNFYHENFKDYITYMKRLVDAGLYDTAALSEDGIKSLVSDDRVSMVYDGCNFGTYDSYLKALYPENPDRVYCPFYIDIDGDSSNGVYGSGNELFGPSGIYFIPSTCENPEAVIRLMDLVYTYEYGLLSDQGIEGVTYTLNDDMSANIITIPSDQKDDIKHTTLAGTGIADYALPCLRVDTRVNTLLSAKPTDNGYCKHLFVSKLRSEYADIIKYAENWAPLALASEEEKEIIEEYQNVLETYASELLTDLILGRKSLDDLDSYVAEMESLGLKEYLQVATDRYNRTQNS